MNLIRSEGIRSRMKELWVFIWLVWNKTPNYDTSSEGPSWICNLYTKLKGLTSLLTSNWYPNFLRTTTPRNLGYESSPNTCIEPWGGWWCTRYMVKRESGSKWTFPILLWLGGLGHEVIKNLYFNLLVFQYATSKHFLFATSREVMRVASWYRKY